MEGVMATIVMVAYDFSPQSFATCNGQLLSINSNQALFALLGTTFGGNGVQTFGLPDLRGRSMVGSGAGFTLGQMSGTESSTILTSNLPPHTHNGNINVAIQASSSAGNSVSPQNAYPALGSYASSNSGLTMKSPDYGGTTIGSAGGSLPVTNMGPYLAVNHLICMYGIFPSRN